MIDTNFTHIRYPNFPEEYVQQLKDLATEILPEGILGDNPTYDDNRERSFLSRNFYDFKINDIKFWGIYMITKPNTGRWFVHKDRSRNFALNIPIQVDPLKGYLLVYNGQDHSDDTYPELGNFIDSTNELTPEIRALYSDRSNDEELLETLKSAKIWPHAKESLFKKVTLDKPTILNTQRPHSFVNYDNKFRVIASLSFLEDSLLKVLKMLEGNITDD